MEFLEGVSLNTIANEVGTPCYVYSKMAIEKAWQAFHQAFDQHPHQIHYAVKANSNLSVLRVLAKLGSGFDIVSIGELARVLKAGGDPRKIVFSGVGKTTQELKEALTVGIGCINVESLPELERLNTLALKLGKKAPIAFRINPNIDPKSHPYISTGREENKFGINILEANTVYQTGSKLPGISIKGLAFHIGSQITSLQPFTEALDKIIALIEELKKTGIHLSHVNVGGGLGVCYADEIPPGPKEYITMLLTKLKPLDLPIFIEPGRAIVANAGVLLTRVEYIKKQGNQPKYFAIVDAAMNDLLRPTLYQAWQEIVPVNTLSDPTLEPHIYDIVGPVCETGDFLGKDRKLCLKEGDLLKILSAGAYGFSMSSNYNSRPRAAEVMVDGNTFHIVRKREKISDLFQLEE